MAVEPIDTALRLAAIVDSSDDAIVSKDLNGIVTSWNRAAERMFGFTSAEMVGQSIRRIVPAERQNEEDTVLASIRPGAPVEHFETERLRKDGTFIPISLTVSPIRDAAGTVVGASKIARDISERKHSQAVLERAARRDAFLAQVTAALARSLDYQQTLRAVANFIVPELADWCAIDLMNDEGGLNRLVVAYGDPAKIKMAEVVRAGYHDPSASYSPELVARTGLPAIVADITEHVIADSAEMDPERLQVLRSLGLVSYMCVPMLAHDRTMGVLTMVTAHGRMRYTEDDLRMAEDVAARAALAAENGQAYQQVATANRLKDEFLATLSHELRTPLNAVLGYVRMLRSGAIPEEKVARALEVIDRNAVSLTQIVEDVLDVSRIVSGKARLEVQPVDLAGILRDSIATVTPAADAKGVKLQSVIDARVGPVPADPNRLQQVFWNLLSNAVKFTPRGGRVVVRLDASNSHVEIVVSDTGIGISPQFLPHIFERFRQEEPGTTRKHGGLGLGLAIVRHLIEMHGGTIEAASDGEGKGSTFRISLPVTPVTSVTPVTIDQGEPPDFTVALEDAEHAHARPQPF